MNIENLPNFYLKYKSIDPNDLVKLGFFVVNWDWIPWDPETLDEITDNFPLSSAVWGALNTKNGYVWL